MMRRAVPATADLVSSNSPDGSFFTDTTKLETPEGWPTRTIPFSPAVGAVTSLTTVPSISAAALRQRPPVMAYALCITPRALVRATRSHVEGSIVLPAIVLYDRGAATNATF